VQVPQATNGEMLQAVDAASEAFKTWSKVSGSASPMRALRPALSCLPLSWGWLTSTKRAVSERQRVMLKYQHLIREHTPELADIITREQVTR
jgi:acyl-CoA reductase-like NAD-dependent aldehyde dehydrogenase